MSTSTQVYAEPDSSKPAKWAEADIAAAVKRGIADEAMLNNYQKGITRGEFCRLCVNTVKGWGLEDMPHAMNDVDFKDIDGNADRDNILLCASLGIVSGMGNGEFQPDRAITRQEAAKMLYNTLNLTDTLKNLKEVNGVNGVFLPHSFNDGQAISSWARSSIYAMYHTEVMVGDNENCFNPMDTYTKEQAIVTFNRLFDTKDKTDFSQNAELYPQKVVADGLSLTEGEYSLYTVEPVQPNWYDGFGNTYSGEEKGFTKPLNTTYLFWSYGLHDSKFIDDNGEDVFKAERARAVYSINSSDDTVILRVSRPEYEYYGYQYANKGYKPYSLSTGKEIKIDEDIKYIYPVGENMYFADCGKYGCYIDGDFNKITDKDCVITDNKFFNGKCVAKKADGSLVLIDKTGKVLKKLNLDLDGEKYKLTAGSGASLILNGDGADCQVYNAADDSFITGLSSAQLALDNRIVIKYNGSEYFYILDGDGNMLFDGKKMGYSDFKAADCFKDTFIAVSDSRSRDVICGFEPVYKGIYGDKLCYDGGVFCAAKSNSELVTFDVNGSELGKIAFDNPSDFKFINGLVYAVKADENHNIEAGGYFTPEGKAAITNFNN